MIGRILGTDPRFVRWLDKGLALALVYAAVELAGWLPWTQKDLPPKRK